MAGAVPDLSLVPQPLWQEAERRAAVLRPLAMLPTCPREQARAAAVTLGVRERSALADARELRSMVLRRSTGLIGEVAALLTAATVHALLHGRERIDRAMLDGCDYRGPDERRALFEASFPRVR